MLKISELSGGIGAIVSRKMSAMSSRKQIELTGARVRIIELLSLKLKHTILALFVLSCLCAASRLTAEEVTGSNTWDFAWHYMPEPAGGYAVVQTITCVPLPPGAPIASKEEWDKHFETTVFNDRMNMIMNTGQNPTNGTKLLVKFFRGPIYTSTNLLCPWKNSATSSKNWVTVISTVDDTRLAAGVDNGPIYFSTNSGVTWETITSPGNHSFPIVVGDGGCTISAVQTILTNEQNAAASNWYAVATGSDGSGLIISGSDSVSSPVLNISVLENQIVLSWPSSISGYTLQDNHDLTTTNWSDVNATPSVFNGFNRVILPGNATQKFYRLKK